MFNLHKPKSCNFLEFLLNDGILRTKTCIQTGVKCLLNGLLQCFCVATQTKIRILLKKHLLINLTFVNILSFF